VLARRAAAAATAAATATVNVLLRELRRRPATRASTAVATQRIDREIERRSDVAGVRCSSARCSRAATVRLVRRGTGRRLAVFRRRFVPYDDGQTDGRRSATQAPIGNYRGGRYAYIYCIRNVHEYNSNNCMSVGKKGLQKRRSSLRVRCRQTHPPR